MEEIECQDDVVDQQERWCSCDLGPAALPAAAPLRSSPTHMMTAHYRLRLHHYPPP
jgi:hypothetical protein